MARHEWTGGHVTSTGEWTPWYQKGSHLEKAMYDGTWVHYLISNLSEPYPDANHVHFKKQYDDKGNDINYVLCSIKVDGMREVNRRELIEKINRMTGLNLQYR